MSNDFNKSTRIFENLWRQRLARGKGKLPTYAYYAQIDDLLNYLWNLVLDLKNIARDLRFTQELLEM